MALLPQNPFFAVLLPGAPPLAVPNEFDMSTRDFERICQLIRRRAGIALNSSKRTMVYSRLARRLRATGKGSFAEYLDWLESVGGAEWQDFINALTTNLTSFFARGAPFSDVLEDHLRRLRGRERLNIWCCAASTGEEPYTIAISAMEAFASLDPPVRIIATDIDTNVLETARAAAYRDDTVAKLAPEIVRKYFVRGNGANCRLCAGTPRSGGDGDFPPAQPARRREWPLRTGFDVVFCRNVMIYFDKDTQFLHPCAASRRCSSRAACCSSAIRKISRRRATCFTCWGRRYTRSTRRSPRKQVYSGAATPDGRARTRNPRKGQEVDKIKVLVVDDSGADAQPSWRALIGVQVDMEVVGTAPRRHRGAGQMIVEFRPDVLTLDIEMPRMDGLQFLERLMQRQSAAGGDGLDPDRSRRRRHHAARSNWARSISFPSPSSTCTRA